MKKILYHIAIILPLFAFLSCVQLKDMAKDIYKKHLVLSNYEHLEKIPSSIKGKTLLWFGTSIPAGGYPFIVGEILDAHVVNRAQGSSIARMGFHCKETPIDTTGWDDVYWQSIAYSLSATPQEKKYYYEYTQTHKVKGVPLKDGTEGEIQYSNKTLKEWEKTSLDYHLKHSVKKADIIIIDHGRNDVWRDDPNDLIDEDISSRDRKTYFGAMNYIIDKIQEWNPKSQIIILSHFTRDHLSVNNEEILYLLQRRIAEYRNLIFLDISDKFPFSSENILDYMPDGVHPSSDITGQTNLMIATEISKQLAGL